MRSGMWLVALAACTAGDSTHYTRDAEVSTVFHLDAWFAWSAEQSPDVVSVAIDRTPIASGQRYEVSEWFTSYEAARAAYQPKTIVVTTTTGIRTTTMALGDCDDVRAQSKSASPLVSEAVSFSASEELGHVILGAYSLQCVYVDGETTGWSARVRARN